MALDETRFADADDLHRWRRILGRILALIPEGELELESMRGLRRALDADGLLAENEPLYQSSTYRGDHVDFVRDQLRRAGVDLETGPNRNVLDASDALHAHVERTTSSSPASELAELWDEAMQLVGLIDANPGLHDQLDHSAWGHVANAVERIASSPNFTPSADGLPALSTMLAVLERLSSSRYPQSREGEA
jgi:hypothetical protein